MKDIEIRQFRDDLLELINNTMLPLEVKRLVLFEISKAVSEASDNYINSQKQSIIKQLEEGEQNAESVSEKKLGE